MDKIQEKLMTKFSNKLRKPYFFQAIWGTNLKKKNNKNNSAIHIIIWACKV